MCDRVLFVGLGGAGQRHLINLKALYADVKVAAIRKKKRNFEIGIDLTSNFSVDIVDKYGIVDYPDVDSAKKFNPDFAVVANPTSLHFQTAIELLQNKIPVFLEKPIATEKDDIQLLKKTAANASTELMVAFQLRFHPCVVEAKRVIESGVLGKIYSAMIHVHSYMPAWHLYENYNELYASKSNLGGGVILTEIHEIDLITWFFGLPESVVCFGGKISRLNLDVEDTVAVLMNMKTTNGNFPLSLNMSFVQNPPSRGFQVYGELGTLELNIPRDSLTVFDNRSQTRKITQLEKFERNNMYKDELRHFIDCHKARKETDLSIGNTIGSQLLANAIKKSLCDWQIVFL